MTWTRLIRGPCLGFALLGVSCDTSSTAPKPARLIRLSEAEQSVDVGEAVPIPPTVRVVDGNANAVPRVEVVWRITAGDGTVFPERSVTDAEGVARTRWTVGPNPEDNELMATIPGVSAVRFRAQAVPLAPVRLVLEPDSVRLVALGDSARLHVRAFDASDNEAPSVSPAWESSDAGIASVGPGGWVFARGNGTARITARVGDLMQTARIVVEQEVASLRVLPEEGTLRALGDTLRLSAVAFDPRGAPVLNPPTRWVSSDSVVQVDSSGLVTSRRVGTARVVVSVAAIADTAVLQVQQWVDSVDVHPRSAVLQVGTGADFKASAFDSRGSPVAEAVFAWTSSAPSIATVDDRGRVEAVADGSATITVRSGESTASAEVSVEGSGGGGTSGGGGGGGGGSSGGGGGGGTPGGSGGGPSATVSVVEVTPSTVTLAIAESRGLTAEALDDSGQPVAGATVTWRSSHPSVASVSANGEVTGVSSGSATITAEAGGKSGTAQVTVTTTTQGRIDPGGGVVTAFGSGVQLVAPAGAVSAPLEITIQPSAAGGAAGIVSGTAYEFGPDGTLFGVPLQLTIEYDPAVLPPGTPESALQIVKLIGGRWHPIPDGEVDVAGNAVSAPIPGFSIYAAAPAVSSVTVAPVVDSIPITATTQLTATLRDEGRHLLPDRVVTWSSSDASVATVDAGGRVTALLPGEATVTATSEGRSGSATITVLPGPVASIELVSGGSQTGTVGTTLPAPLEVRISDAQGNPVPGASVRWVVGDGAGSVSPETSTTDPEGIARTTWTLGESVGTQSVEVSVSGAAPLTVQATATVGPASAETSEVEVEPASLPADGASTATVTVRLRDAFGNALASGGNAVALSTTAGSPGPVTDHGDGTYSATLTAPEATGSATVGATLDGSAIEDTATIAFTLGAASGYRVSLSADAPVAGQPVTVTAQLVDAQDRELPAAGHVVAWSSTAGGTFSAPSSTTDASGRTEVVFTPSTRAGIAHTLTAREGEISGTRSLTTRTGEAARLAFAVQPPDALAGEALAPAVEVHIQDAHENPVTSSALPVTLALGVNPSGGGLEGTLTVAAVDGVATFGDLSLELAADGYTLAASAEGLSGAESDAFGVSPAAPSGATSEVEVEPASLPADGASTATVTVRLRDAFGNALASGGNAVALSTTAGSLGPVTDHGDGTYTGILTAPTTAGTALVTATVGGEAIAAEASVILFVPVANVSVDAPQSTLEVGETLQLTASVSGSDGSVLTGRSLTWESSDDNLATVDQSGLVTGDIPGEVTISATSEGRSGSVALTVVPAAPSVLEVRSGNDQSGTVASQLPAPLVVRIMDSRGTPVEGASVGWEASGAGAGVSPATSTTDALGETETLWTLGTQAGAQTVTATVDGLPTVAFTATAAPGPAASLVVAPDSVELDALEDTVRLSVSASDQHGNALSTAEATWTSLDPMFLASEGDGKVRALANGRARVEASLGGVADTAVVRISQRAVAVTITPAADTLDALGAMLELSAEVTDSNGSPVVGASLVWSSLDPAVLSVDADGTVVAEGTGVGRIRVAAGSLADTAEILVRQRLASLTLGSVPATFEPGDTARLVATAEDANGEPIPDAIIDWSTSDAEVATVSGSGLVTAQLPGEVTITAESDDESASVALTVTPPELLASQDFENGTLGPFRYLYTQFPEDLQVVDDPTDSGRGKVVQIHYAGSGTDGERNRSFAWQPSQAFATPGSSIFFRGELNLGTWNGAADDQRKLLYWLDHPSSSAGSVYSILYLMRNTLHYQGGSAAGVKTFTLPPPRLQQNTWYTIELQVTLNSAYDRSDGVARLWIDGEMVWEDTTMRFLPASGYSFGLFMVGDQVNANEAFDEYRFWDNVAFARKRIGPQ